MILFIYCSNVEYSSSRFRESKDAEAQVDSDGNFFILILGFGEFWNVDHFPFVFLVDLDLF